MKNNAKIKVINILSAVAVMILIGVMCYVSLQHAEPRRDICYTADFSDMHVGTFILNIRYQMRRVFIRISF